ncbi:MAG: chloride channel protein, partial [Planctomycetota bacterium]
MLLIAGITNLAFYGRWSLDWVGPAGHQLGAWVVLVPVAGALVIGVMARYGSAAIRGHGIPEAMDQVLHNGSRIPARMAWLKPLSAAISIGTGGPFGAEGPIIATGGALGSLLGQLLRTTADERKTLLAAGAAAGMAATFGSPVSAVLLAVELLLFEYRPRSILPVAIAAVGATGVRYLSHGAAPAFDVGSIGPATSTAVLAYLVVGALVGLGAVVVTKLVYGVEDQFARLPLHWMWWPALGALVVGAIGWYEPHTMGVGYDNIEGIV